MSKSYRHSIFFVMLAVLGFFQYRLWFESGGVRDMLALRQSLAKQASQTLLMKQNNDDLVLQVKQLRQGENATESRARSELGMIKKGETFYQYVK